MSQSVRGNFDSYCKKLYTVAQRSRRYTGSICNSIEETLSDKRYKP